MLENASSGLGGFERGRNAIPECGALFGREHGDASIGKVEAALLQPVQCVEHDTDLLRDRVNQKRVILSLESSRDQAKDSEARREALAFWEWLRAHASMRGREANDRSRIPSEPARTLERENIRRIRYDLGTSQRREHFVLTGEPHGRAHAEGRNGRQLNRFKSGSGSEQLTIDANAGPLIDNPRLHEAISIPLLHQSRRPALGGTRLHHIE
jgi:hypothetical protein